MEEDISKDFRKGQTVRITFTHDGLPKGSIGIVRQVKHYGGSIGIEVIDPDDWDGHNLDGKCKGLRTGWWVPRIFLEVISQPYNWKKL